MPNKSINNIYKKRVARMRAAQKEAVLNSKSSAITDEVTAELAKLFGCNEPISKNATALAKEHKLFERTSFMTIGDAEELSEQTVVGICRETRGKFKGCYVMILNKEKTVAGGMLGLGFPGGRVHPGESPIRALLREISEETGLTPEIINSGDESIASHKVGEPGLEHEFMAYAGDIVAGKPIPGYTKDEPIVSVVFLEETLLAEVCRNGGNIEVAGHGSVGILRSHRLAFNEYMAKKDRQKTVEVGNV